jgi:hypothetical protein
VAYLSDGPQVILGSAADLDAKWIAAAAILSDSTSRGAEYVDVRLPDRPVAGGLDLPPPAPDEQPGAADAPAKPPPSPDATTTTPGTTAPPGTSGTTTTGTGTTGTGTTAPTSP